MSHLLTIALVLSSGGTTIGLAIRIVRAERASARVRDRISQYTGHAG